jgi:serine/threonine protein kinase
MVAMCLVKDPTKRPTAEKLLKHQFFKNVKSPEVSLKKILADLPPLWDRVKALQVRRLFLIFVFVFLFCVNCC